MATWHSDDSNSACQWKTTATVFSYLCYHGGIQPRQRSRALISLSLEEREEISRGLAAGRSIRSIADLLERTTSTRSSSKISTFAAVLDAKYIPSTITRVESPAPGPSSLVPTPRIAISGCPPPNGLKGLVTRKLSANCSPEQISGWLKLTYPDNESLRMSPETIYKSLFIQTRGLFRKEMRNHLRTRR